MKATVYFIELSKDQVADLNSSEAGWGSKIGKAYLAARDGRIDSTNFDLLKKAATLEAATDEQVWMRLQNHEAPWTADTTIEAHLTFTRSMDIGDLIVWEDGRRARVESCGFEEVRNAWDINA